MSVPARIYLEALPRHLRVNSSVVVCHGNLASADTYISTFERAEEAMAQLRVEHPSAEVLVCGHTHHAALFTRESGFRLMGAGADHGYETPCLINPGAVGQSRDGRPLASYALLDTERRRVSFREVSYDYRATIRKLREARLVAKVVWRPPRGLWRQVEKYKVRWARYFAERL